VIAARCPELRGGAAPDAGRARRGAVQREGFPDVQAVLRSGGGAVAAQNAIGQPKTPQQIGPERASPSQWT